SAKTVFALDVAAIENNAAAIARPDDDRDGGLAAVRTKDGIVTPKRGGICIVQIGDRFSELLRQTLANIESRPMRMNKVRGTSRAELARCTGRTGRIQADRDDVREENTGFFGGNLKEANLRPLLGQRRILT